MKASCGFGYHKNLELLVEDFPNFSLVLVYLAQFDLIMVLT